MVAHYRSMNMAALRGHGRGIGVWAVRSGRLVDVGSQEGPDVAHDPYIEALGQTAACKFSIDAIRYNRTEAVDVYVSAITARKVYNTHSGNSTRWSNCKLHLSQRSTIDFV